jgi:hypothetical protein
VKGIAMSDLQEQPADGGVPGIDAAPAEIARSLGSAWERYSGQRPKSTRVEMGEDVVRCVIEEAPDALDDEASDGAGDPRLSAAGLQRNATLAVSRITGRRVIAFIAKRNQGAEISTQTFILDQPRQRF